MAYEVLAGSVIEMQYRYTIQGQQCINVFHYLLGSASIDGAADLQQFVATFAGNVAAPLQAFQTTDVTLCHVRGQYVHATRFVPYEEIVLGGAGTATPPTESIGTCAVLRKLTDVANRSSRGRIYLGGLAQTAIDIGTLTQTIYDGLLAAWVDAVTFPLEINEGANTGTPIVWSYSDPFHKPFITNGSVDRYARYQRRREVGRGI